MDKQELLLKLVEMLVSTESLPVAPVQKKLHIGEKVIVRCRDAGVHYGTLIDYKGREVVLGNARRMWRWWASQEMTLSAVAEHGLNLDKGLRIQGELSEDTVLMDGCEILKASPKCISSFVKVESYNEQ